jgi:shikimate kinase
MPSINPYHSIFLIGFMGCGKTTLGRKLASRLGYSFIDLDEELEKQVGVSINEYFSKYGEAKFREMESQTLKQITYPAKAIISTGGGLPCYFDNMEWMNNHGKTLYVKLPAKTLADRLKNGKANRPVLQNKNGDELVAFIEQKLSEREVYYNQATYISESVSLTAEKAEEIIFR